MAFKTSLFYLPSVGSRADITAGMAGLRGDLYGRMLQEVGEQARLADALGYDSINFTEHHFHIEGIELSNNPVMLDLFIGMQTKRIRVGQLGIVLPADNPLRIAEDIAMLDHMTGGRANAGFARGYQRRWVDVMAQHTHGVHGVAPHQHDAVDASNRAAFEENFRIIKQCWTQDMLRWEGKLWRIPVEGTPWTVEASSKYGKGIVDGIVREIGVVPKPLQKPHPPLFQPFASSESSIRWCAKEGVTAVLPPMHAKHETRLSELYAAESGRRVGDGVAFLRDIVIADSDAEADHLWQQSSRFMGQEWFEPFGFRRGMIDPDTGATPTPQEMIDLGYVLVGTVDTVCRRFESMLKRLPVEWIFCWTFNGLVPNAAILRTLERWQTQVLPKLGLA